MNQQEKIKQLQELDGRISNQEEWTSLAYYLLFLRHMKAYLYAEQYCEGKIVLDYGCGNGYGSFFLSKISHNITAVDINKAVIEMCKQNYQADNLSFQAVEPEKKTFFKDAYFDVVVSFQVIEHIYDVRGYLNEMKRVLKDDGVFIITTPNRKYRLYPFQKPLNPYHVREYGLRQLKKELHAVFKNAEILGVNGTDEINTIEYNRVKKTLIKAFVRPPFKRLIKTNFFKLFTNEDSSSREKKKSPAKIKKEILSRYSVDDYLILEENVNKGLDFLSILRKN
jgi:2-polyprenyl-3-methyl-5-hydroxy-6-metoxy-1,4-benzoquinol methylase